MMGILFIIFSSLLFGIEPSICNLALSQGVNVSEATAVIILVIILICLLSCLLRHEPVRVNAKQGLRLFGFGVLGTGLTNYLLGCSYKFIPVGCSTVLHFMYPTFVCVIMRLVFGQKMRADKIMAILCSIAGLLLIGSGELRESLPGIALALGSGLAYGLYVICLDRFSVSEEEGKESRISDFLELLYVSLGGFAFSAAAILLEGGFSMKLTPVSVGYLLVVGIMEFGGYFLFLLGVRRAGATISSFFSLLEPVTSLIFSAVFYRYALGRVTIAGCVISLAAMIIIGVGESLKKE